MTTKQLISKLWEEMRDEQAESLVGGAYVTSPRFPPAPPAPPVIKNPGGKVFDKMPGKGHMKGKGKAKDNWESSGGYGGY